MTNQIIKADIQEWIQQNFKNPKALNGVLKRATRKEAESYHEKYLGLCGFVPEGNDMQRDVQQHIRKAVNKLLLSLCEIILMREAKAE